MFIVSTIFQQPKVLFPNCKYWSLVLIADSREKPEKIK